MGDEESYLVFEAVTRTRGSSTHRHSHHGNRVVICDVSTIRSTYSQAFLLPPFALHRSNILFIWSSLCNTCLLFFVSYSFMCMCMCSYATLYVSMWLCMCMCFCEFAGLNKQYWLMSRDVTLCFSAHYIHLNNNEQVNLCSCAWPKLKTTLSPQPTSFITLLQSIRTNEKNHCRRTLNTASKSVNQRHLLSTERLLTGDSNSTSKSHLCLCNSTSQRLVNAVLSTVHGRQTCLFSSRLMLNVTLNSAKCKIGHYSQFRQGFWQMKPSVLWLPAPIALPKWLVVDGSESKAGPLWSPPSLSPVYIIK